MVASARTGKEGMVIGITVAICFLTAVFTLWFMNRRKKQLAAEAQEARMMQMAPARPEGLPQQELVTRQMEEERFKPSNGAITATVTSVRPKHDDNHGIPQPPQERARLQRQQQEAAGIYPQPQTQQPPPPYQVEYSISGDYRPYEHIYTSSPPHAAHLQHIVADLNLSEADPFPSVSKPGEVKDNSKIVTPPPPPLGPSPPPPPIHTPNARGALFDSFLSEIGDDGIDEKKTPPPPPPKKKSHVAVSAAPPVYSAPAFPIPQEEEVPPPPQKPRITNTSKATALMSNLAEDLEEDDGWIKSVNQQGKTFYFNTKTGATSWTLPA